MQSQPHQFQPVKRHSRGTADAPTRVRLEIDEVVDTIADGEEITASLNDINAPSFAGSADISNVAKPIERMIRDGRADRILPAGSLTVLSLPRVRSNDRVSQANI